ncbi:MAG: hypothetical protein LBN06_10035 [Prevotellaceae bacterium]|nr:hypothetical protein [Prevotellaceae bacterium]
MNTTFGKSRVATLQRNSEKSRRNEKNVSKSEKNDTSRLFSQKNWLFHERDSGFITHSSKRSDLLVDKPVTIFTEPKN